MSPTATALGFADPRYARSLAEWGEPWLLPASGGSVLLRTVPGVSMRDAAGPYPFLACQDWDALCDDVEALPDDLVSLTFVVDPFGSFELGRLRRCLDEVKAFKARHVADLSVPPDRRFSKKHRRTSMKAPAGYRGRGPDRADRSSRRVVRPVCPHRPTLRIRRDPRLLPPLLRDAAPPARHGHVPSHPSG